MVWAIGRLRVEDVEQAHISRLHQGLKATPYKANRVLAVRSKMFDEAVRKGYRRDNPCKGIKRFTEDSRETYLTPDEIARLTEVLNNYKRREFASFIKLLMFTGARRGETMAAKWEHFDLDRGTWTKPGTTTKQKRKHATPLHDGAVVIQHGRLAHAGCILPLTLQDNLPEGVGTRHRAAVGITEETDAVVIVVSEETAKISVVMNGEMVRGLDAPQLRVALRDALSGARELGDAPAEGEADEGPAQAPPRDADPVALGEPSGPVAAASRESRVRSA